MEISTTINESIESINTRLDKFENDLPAVPKAVLRLNRAAGERVWGSTERAASNMVDAFGNVSESATKTYKTFVSTAQKASSDFVPAFDTAQKFAEDTVAFATKGVKQVAGQFGIALDNAEEDVVETVKATTAKVKSSETKAAKAGLSSKTKAELYEMAKDVDLDGRATMSKGELVKALAKV